MGNGVKVKVTHKNKTNHRIKANNKIKDNNKTNANNRKKVTVSTPTKKVTQKQTKHTSDFTRQYTQFISKNVNEPMIVLNADQKVITANHAFYEAFNLEPENTKGKLIYNLNNKQWNIPKLRQLLRTNLTKKNTYSKTKLEVKLPSKKKAVLELNALRMPIVPGGSQIIFLVIKNVPGRRVSGEDQALTYLKETLESTDDGILAIDMDKNIKVYNHRFIELFDIPEHIIAPKDYKLVMRFIIRKLIDSKRFWDITNELDTDPSAESFDIIETRNKVILEFYSKPQRIDDEIVGRVWSFRDITSRKWAENAFKTTYTSFHNILESSKDGIIVVDEKGRICFFNNAAESMFRGNVDEQLSEQIGVQNFVGDMKEIEIERLEGGIGIAEMRVVKTEWEGNTAYLAMLRDITDRKQAEKELKMHKGYLEVEVKKRTNELIQAEKMGSLGQLVSGVAHEINNPLAFIKSNTEFLKDLVSDLTEDFKQKNLSLEPLEEIYDLLKINIVGINRITSITTTLKRFAKPGEEGKSLANLNQGIKDTLLIVGNKLKHRVKVHENYADLPKVMCNIKQLNQVFMNIIINASEAMDQGNLFIKTWKQGEKIFIEFMDDGKGIPEDELTKIFDPFFTTKETGTGLGLSLSYRIIQDHNGNMKVESEVGQGTKFIIEIPMGYEND